MWGYICPSVRIPLFSIPQISGRDSECLAECLNEIEIFFFLTMWLVIFFYIFFWDKCGILLKINKRTEPIMIQTKAVRQ